MEQPNGMMPNGLPAGPNHTMQRPQNGNWTQQLYAKVLESLRASLVQLQNSWQGIVDIRERAGKIMQLITMLRAINPHSSIQGCIQIAQTFEMRTLQNAQSREQYNEEMNNKMRDITARRQQQADQIGLPGGMMPGQNNQMPNMLNNMGNMPPNGLPIQNGGIMGMQPGQMNFGQNQMFNAQLQRPMQPSPLNMQQQQPQQPQPQSQQQLQNQHQQPNTMDPSALQLPAQQQNLSQAMQNMGQPNMTQPQNMSGQQIPQEIAILAKRMFDQMPDDTKNTIRSKYLSSMTAEQRSTVKGDPVMRICAQRVAQQLARARQNGNLGAPLNKPGMQNDGMSNMQIGNNVPQRPPSQTGGQIDFGNLLGQQANARKLQESGEQVVPASNNAMGMGGNQMNMPQNINSLMLANQANQGGQPNNGAMNRSQAQFLFMQQEQQRRERESRTLTAHQHAMASRNQLQGMPGGLHAQTNFNNGPAGQVNSPAMSMLNRPMAPPGQATPNTPQPNRQQPTPNTPMNNAVALSQHHQNMVQNNQQQQQQQQMMPPMPANPTIADMLARVPPQLRARLDSMPEEQVKQFLWKWTQSQGNRRQGQPGQPGQPGQAGQTGLQNNMAAPQQNNRPMQNPLQQQMANAVPGFNTQPPPNQTQMDQNQQQRMQQINKFKSQAMDMAAFPRSILASMNLTVPPQVHTWGQLKQYTMRTSGQEAVQRVQQQQIFSFQDANAVQAAMRNLSQLQQQRMMQAAQGNLQGQPQMQGNNVQPTAAAVQVPPAQMAPPAQMVPPAPLMQAPNSGMPQMPNQGVPRMPSIPPPTPQDIAVFRSKIPQTQNMTDDQIKSLIIKNKIERFRGFQQAQQQKQLQASQASGQPNQTGMLPQSNISNAAQPPRTPQHPPNQPATGKTNQSKAASQSNNDVIEISSQVVQRPAPQGFQMQNNQAPALPRPQMPRPTQEQLNQMTDVQKTQYFQKVQMQAMAVENFRKAQGQAGQNAGSMPTFTGPVQVEKIRRMLQEVTSANPKGPAIQIDEAGLQRAKEKLKKLFVPLRQLTTTYAAALAYGFDEQRIKELMRAQEIVMQNALDESGQIKDYLSVTPEVLQDLERTVTAYMVELKSRKEQLDAQKKRALEAAKQGQPASGPQQAPAMAATTSQQNHARKTSASTKAPPAPTENKTFDWNPRPDGVPKYDSTRNDLTPDKLKFPPTKRRRTDQANSQASTPAAHAGTPAAAGASPAIGKVQSPEQQRKSQAHLKAEAEREAEKKKFRCKDPACESSLHGFESEEQLKQHEQTQHQPLENPLAFLLENAAKALGVDEDSKAAVAAAARAKAEAKAAAARPKPPLIRRRIATVQDLNPADLTKEERGARGGVPASIEPKLKKKQAEFDAETTAARAAQQEMTLAEAMAQKLDIPYEHQAIEYATAGGVAELADFDEAPLLAASNEEWAPCTGDDFAEWLADGWMPTAENKSIWELRPGLSDSQSSPELTPGSQSSDVHLSDTMKFTISMENMDADLFGDGSGGAPESLVGLYGQIKDMAVQNSGEDATMGGTDDKPDQSPKKRKADDDWAKPVRDVFDDFFSYPEGE